MPKGKRPFSSRVATFTPYMGLRAHDATNVTCSTRDLNEYSRWLFADEMALKERLIALKERLGKPLVILDAGCGQGYASRQLLSDPALEGIIASVIGVSLHHFHSLESLATDFPSRFRYYPGTVQNVLRKSTEQVHVILDLWGALAYSADKLSLLHQYHDVLVPGGQLYAFQRLERHTTQTLIHEGDETTELFPFLHCQPGFSWSRRQGEKDTLLYQKNQAHFPITGSISMTCSEETNITTPKIKHSRRLAAAGNALVPKTVTYTLHSRTSLRSKPY
ncbi:MAG: hypothetical protein CMF48_07590 [Legionellales bacterium]|nr:hypothetical protein [Legionellales bacterium]|tara:strand:- start:597 stop:1427 length:831 start_codon:yes stop_codon:yes gene_type:complete